jgi:PHD/YefM family antitoxin component YafN of YafNO toxin-antitoxin module
MGIHSMNVSELRRALNAVVDRLTRPLFVIQRGRIRAVLLDIDQYNRMLDALDDAQLACDPEVRQAIADAERAAPEDWVPLRDTLLDR